MSRIQVTWSGPLLHARVARSPPVVDPPKSGDSRGVGTALGEQRPARAPSLDPALLCLLDRGQPDDLGAVVLDDERALFNLIFAAGAIVPEPLPLASTSMSMTAKS